MVHSDATNELKPALNQKSLKAVPQSEWITWKPPDTALEVLQHQIRMMAGTPVHILQHNKSIDVATAQRPPGEGAQLFAISL